MISDNFVYGSMLKNMSGKWLPLIFTYALWTVCLIALAFVPEWLLEYWLIEPSFKTYILTTLYSWLLSGLTLYVYAATPLAIVRKPNSFVFTNSLAALKDLPRILLFSILLVIVYTVLTTIIGFLCYILGLFLVLGSSDFFVMRITLFFLICFALPTALIMRYFVYNFCLVPNFLYDNPKLSVLEAFNLSKDAMTGYRLMLFKHQLPIVLFIAVISVGLFSATVYTVGGQTGIQEMHEMLNRQEIHAQLAEEYRQQEIEENRLREIRDKKLEKPVETPVYDPETMTKDQYIQLLKQHEKRVKYQEDAKDFAKLDDFIKTTERINKKSTAPTHHDDEVMARIKHVKLFLLLFAILIFFTLPMLWAIQNEIYLIIATAPETQEELKKNLSLPNPNTTPSPSKPQRKEIAFSSTPENTLSLDNSLVTTDNNSVEVPNSLTKREVDINLNFDFGTEETDASQNQSALSTSTNANHSSKLSFGFPNDAPAANNAKSQSDTPEIPYENVEFEFAKPVNLRK